MKTKNVGHAPGPWEAVGYCVWRKARERQKTQRIASIHTAYRSMQECDANACLIAAAPDLLEALETLCTGPIKIHGADVWKRARLAIDKARGVEQ